MSATFDFVDTVRKAIDARISSGLEQLVACDASKHDKLAGTIAGLKSARKELLATAKKWQSSDFDEDGESDGVTH